MARFYANENFPFPVVASLRQIGHEVLTSLEAGNAGQRVPDQQGLAFAIGHQRTVLTLNRRHFVRLHLQQPQHSGIVVCTYDADFDALASRIDSAVAPGINLAGQLIRINRPPAS